jgi:hypothetical protein
MTNNNNNNDTPTSFSIPVDDLQKASGRPFHLQERMSKRAQSTSPDLAETKRQAMLDARRQRLALRSHSIKEAVDQQRTRLDSEKSAVQATLAKNQDDAEKKRKQRIRSRVEHCATSVGRAKKVAETSKATERQATESLRSALEERLMASEFRRQVLLKVPRSKLMDEDVVAVELMRNQHAAKRIQRSWRMSNVRGLVALVKSVTFGDGMDVFDMNSMSVEQMMSALQNPSLIDAIDKLLKAVCGLSGSVKSIKNTPKVFLSAYMVVYHTEEIMVKMSEMEQVSS